MDQDKEIILEGMPYFRIYKDLKIERFDVIDLSPPSFDSSTKVSSKDIEIIPEINLSARLYRPMFQNHSPKRIPVIIHYHGGGFVVGSAATSPLHNYLNALVAKANVILVSVNYRLATEHMVPVAYEDSWLALQWVASHAVSGTDNYCRDSWLIDHADFTRVYLSGESSGANIAHNLAMLAGTKQLEHNVQIKGIILIHPYFLGPEVTESESFNPKMSSGLRRLWAIVCPSSTGVNDYRINPMADNAPSLKNIGCDRVLVCVGGKDPLKDKGIAYYHRLKEDMFEGRLELFEAQGEEHVFHVHKPASVQAQAQDKRICDFINH